MTAPTVNAASVPLVQARMSIESPLFRSSLPEQRAQVEESVSEGLAAKANSFFPFLRWRSDDSDATAALLTLKMTEKEITIGGEKLHRIYLHYEAQRRVDGILTPFEEPIAPPTYEARSPGDCEARPEIYRSWESNFPNHNAEQLTEDLLCHVDRHFASDDFRQRLHQYLKEIVLFDDLIIDAEEQRLVLPVKWDELKASDKSVLRVEFETKPPGEHTQTGKMELKPDLRAFSDEWENYVQCLVQLLRFRDIFINTPIPWDPHLPAVLQHRRRLQIFMEEYSKDIGARTPTEPF